MAHLNDLGQNNRARSVCACMKIRNFEPAAIAQLIMIKGYQWRLAAVLAVLVWYHFISKAWDVLLVYFPLFHGKQTEVRQSTVKPISHYVTLPRINPC